MSLDDEMFPWHPEGYAASTLGQRKFRCSKGHVCECLEPLTVSFGEATTKPLCRECIIEALNSLASMTELPS